VLLLSAEKEKASTNGNNNNADNSMSSAGPTRHMNGKGAGRKRGGGERVKNSFLLKPINEGSQLQKTGVS